MHQPSRAGTALMLLCCCVSHAVASQNDDKSPSFSAEIAVGGEYDSNVAVDELDQSSNKSDNALTLDGEIAMEKPLTKDAELKLSYDFSQNFYQEFDELNRQTHILGANLEQEFSKADTGLSMFYISSLLDGDKFLSLFRVSPSVSGFLGKKWFGRTAYVYSDKSLHQNSARDATTNAGEGDLYYFHRGLRSYFNIGYRYRDENAKTARYDYSSQSVKLRYIHRFELPSRTIKLELAWRYEDRDYRADTPSIGKKRSDQRQRWQVDVELPLGDALALQFYTSYGDYSSNYAPADYNQLVAGSRVSYRW